MWVVSSLFITRFRSTVPFTVMCTNSPLNQVSLIRNHFPTFFSSSVEKYGLLLSFRACLNCILTVLAKLSVVVKVSGESLNSL